MTEKEIFNKNLEISNEFSRYILSHPEIEDQIPPDAQIVFLVENDPELSKYNLELAKRQSQGESNQRLILVKIKGLRPVEETRLIEPHLEIAA